MTAVEAAVARIQASDRRLAEEFRAVRERWGASLASSSAPRGLESVDRGGPQAAIPQSLETIVLRTGRPVLPIVQDAPRLEFREGASEVWRERLSAAAEGLRRAARAVGRIDVAGHSQLQWVGTGWLIAPDTIATNRHVATEFARFAGDGFVFRRGLTGRPMTASVDLLREIDRSDRFELTIVEVLHIETDDGPDIALLRVEASTATGALPPAIPLADAAAAADQQIAVIGYPARDSRVPDQRLMLSIFGDVYDTKRLAPGQITTAQPTLLLHDCSTLGGNSGSVLVDLPSGRAVGLHFAGRFLEANYAVPASLVADRLDAVRRRAAGGRPQAGVATPAPGSAGPHARPPASNPTHPGPPVPEPFVEARPADYIGRSGYDPDFLGVPVPLPIVSNDADVLTVTWNGREERELRYQHFSVVMSRSRRLCFVSAANVDGNRPQRLKRPSWRLDPRIPAAAQIKEECYGPEPLFSRGHMTRREDPVWGDAAAARLGNQDSMHVTNTVPQMQPFNAGIWLGLEDYALDHAREDAMRISVFTGPFLLDDDPVRHSVRVPRAFWKVIAFIHDVTGELCATGYTMSQEEFLREEEFVYGQHRTWQTPLHAIERRAGLRFGALTALDPLADISEGPSAPLTDFSGILFRRSAVGS